MLFAQGCTDAKSVFAKTQVRLDAHMRVKGTLTTITFTILCFPMSHLEWLLMAHGFPSDHVKVHHPYGDVTVCLLRHPT
jgi:hypothetical protein